MHKDPIQPLFAGQKMVILPSCHSTNQVATDLLAEGKADDGTVVITDHQTAGKGQRGNSWESKPFQNLTFSIILKPKFLAIENQFQLTMITSLAIIQTLNHFNLASTFIKWPNDIYCEENKLAGILIENTLRSDQLESSIIGMGINVNQSEFQTPHATSMRLQTGQSFLLQDVLHVLLAYFQDFYQQLKSGDHGKITESYLAQLYWRHQHHSFRNLITNRVFSGSIQGIDSKGRLLIREDDQRHTFGFREIAFLE